MGKNNYLINLEKRYRVQFDLMTTKMYAAIGISSCEYLMQVRGLSPDEAREATMQIFTMSQKLWQIEDEYSGTGEALLKKCKDDYGIDIRFGLNSTEDAGWVKE